MKSIKGFILFMIALCTTLAILYLSFQVKNLEKYTGAIDYSDKCYILFSSDGGKIKSGENISKVISFVSDYIKQLGMDSIVINEMENNKIKDEIIDILKRNRKYILIDINPTNLISNEGTILIRLGKKDNSKYEGNLEYASRLKEVLGSKYANIKVNLLTDSKNNYNQDLGSLAIRIDISQNLSYENAKILTSHIIDALTQLE